MSTQKIIREFFEEQFNDTSQLFLFKDKQLLNEGKYREYAEEQISKANNTFRMASLMIFVLTISAAWNFVEYGSEAHWSDLAFGIIFLALLMYSLLKTAKEYYSIKSSMSLLIKFLNKKDRKSGNARK